MKLYSTLKEIMINERTIHILGESLVRLPTKGGLSGRGSGRLSKWSRFRAFVDAANFLKRGPCLGAQWYLEGLVLG